MKNLINPVYSIAEASCIMGICKTLVYREIKERRLVAHKCGRRTLILATAINAWINSLSVMGGQHG